MSMRFFNWTSALGCFRVGACCPHCARADLKTVFLSYLRRVVFVPFCWFFLTSSSHRQPARCRELTLDCLVSRPIQEDFVMKFDKHSRWAATVIAAVAFTSLLSTAARAEDAAGKFVLTHPAHWGAVVLAPGEYTYKLEHQPSELLLIRAANGAPGFMVLCTSVSSTTPGTPDSLKLQKMGEEW